MDDQTDAGDAGSSSDAPTGGQTGTSSGAPAASGNVQSHDDKPAEYDAKGNRADGSGSTKPVDTPAEGSGAGSTGT